MFASDIESANYTLGGAVVAYTPEPLGPERLVVVQQLIDRIWFDINRVVVVPDDVDVERWSAARSRNRMVTI